MAEAGRAAQTKPIPPTRRRARRAAAALLVASGVLQAVPRSAPATDRVWDGDTPNSWTGTSGAAWNPNGVPVSGDTLLLGSSIPGTMTIDAAIGAKSITFADGFNGSNTTTIGGSASGLTVTLDSGWTFADNAASGTVTLQTKNTASTGATTLVLNGPGTLTVANAAALSISSVVGGAGGFTKEGTGTFTLSGANAFTGKVTINAGVVALGNDGGLGKAPGPFVADQLTLNGGIVRSTGAFSFSSNRGVTLGASGGTFDTSGGSITLGKVAGTLGGALTKTGGGTLLLSGQQTHNGATNVLLGTVQLSGGADRLPTGTVVNLGDANSANVGALDLHGNSQQVAGLNSVSGGNASSANNNSVSNASTATTLTLGGGGTYSFGDGSNANSGVITGAIGVVKSGSGTQAFGDDNTYTGGTSVAGGTLLANSKAGKSATGPGTVDVGTGVAASGRLGGNGYITGSVNINAGGTLSPGAAGLGSIGTLHNDQDVGALQTWAGGGKYEWEGDFSQNSFDTVAVVSLAVAATPDQPFQIQVVQVGSAGPTPDQWVTIASSTGGDLTGWDSSKFQLPDNYAIRAVTGSGATIPDGSDYSGVFSVQISAAPEPTTPLMFAAGVFTLGLLRLRGVPRGVRSAWGLLTGL